MKLRRIKKIFNNGIYQICLFGIEDKVDKDRITNLWTLKASHGEKSKSAKVCNKRRRLKFVRPRAQRPSQHPVQHQPKGHQIILDRTCCRWRRLRRSAKVPFATEAEVVDHFSADDSWRPLIAEDETCGGLVIIPGRESLATDPRIYQLKLQMKNVFTGQRGLWHSSRSGGRET